MGGEIPVNFPKGSVFMSFLRVFLRHKRERESYTPPGPDTVKVTVPKFPGKDPVYYNYLPKGAQVELTNLVREDFDVQLYRDMGVFDNATQKKRCNELLSLWMEENGIEVNDKNWNAVAKRLQILRRRAYDRERKRNDYNGRKSK